MGSQVVLPAADSRSPMEHDLTRWRPVFAAVARRLYATRAPQHPRVLIEDLLQIGYEALVRYGPNHPHLLSRAIFDMRTFLDRWLYGIPPGTARKHRASRLIQAVEWTPRESRRTTRTPEAIAADREIIRRVWSRLSAPARGVLLATCERYPDRLGPGDVPMTRVTAADYRKAITATGLAVLGARRPVRFHRRSWKETHHA